MKKNIEHRNNDGMRPEYDFASMKGGVCGKHYEPDVAAAFPTEDAVNEALRGILGTARAVPAPPDHSLQTRPGRQKRRGSRA
jgi:hypothetical protein